MAYGKIHQSFFSSSIVETDVDTRFVFMSMIVLSDKDGRLDTTRQALARRINVSLETVDRAIDVLMAPDPISRTAEHEGRRLLPLDPARSWGWVVVNKGIYRHSSDEDQKEQARERQKKHRERARDSAGVSNPDTQADAYDTSHIQEVTPSHVVSQKSVTRRKQLERPQGFAEIAGSLRTLAIIKRGTSPQQQLISEWATTPGATRILQILDENRDRILAADRPFAYLAAIVRGEREQRSAPDRSRSNTTAGKGGDDDLSFDLHE